MAEIGDPTPRTPEPDACTESLLAAFRAGEAQAALQLEAWVRRAAGPFRAPLGADWEDAVQESLLKLWAALRQTAVGDERALAAYVKRVAGNACLDRLRSRRVWKWVDLAELQLPAAATSALERLTRQESAELLLDVLAAMPEDCRRLWRLVLDGLSYREMSERLGATEGALRVRVLRCRRKATALWRRLRRRGGE